MNTICLVNRSTLVDDLEVKRVALAIGKQLSVEVARFWPVDVEVKSCGKTEPIPFRQWPLFVYDEAMPSNDFLPVGARGSHELRKTPVGAISLRQCAKDNTPWSQTASHEALEMAINPTGTTYRLVNGRMWLQDICNPTVVGYYCDDNLLLSNFVTPRWFSAVSGDRLDYTGRVLAPLTPEVGGYCPNYGIDQGDSGT